MSSKLEFTGSLLMETKDTAAEAGTPTEVPTTEVVGGGEVDIVGGVVVEDFKKPGIFSAFKTSALEIIPPLEEPCIPSAVSDLDSSKCRAAGERRVELDNLRICI